MRQFVLAMSAALLLAAAVMAEDAMKKSEGMTSQTTSVAADLTTPTTMAEVDKPAPNFTLTSSVGTQHSLADFKGKIVVLEWTNYDCPFVRKFYGSQTMQKLQAMYTKKGVIWLSINSSAAGKEGNFDAKTIAERMKSSKAAPTAYLMDPDGTVGRMYGAKTTPHMFVINADGVLVYAGAMDDKRSTDQADLKGAKNYVTAALDAIMAGKPVEVKTSVPYGCSVKYATPAPASN